MKSSVHGLSVAKEQMFQIVHAANTAKYFEILGQLGAARHV